MKLGFKIFALFFLSMALSCEDSGTGFKGEKIEKEKTSASTDGTEDQDAEATPPQMISGAFLVCQWVDEAQGQGGCTLVDDSGIKLDKIETQKDWWKIVERDGGQEVETDFTPEPASGKYHVSFGSTPELIADKTGLDLILTYPGGTKRFGLNRVFGEAETATVGREGLSVFTALRDLSISESKKSEISEEHRNFRMWPDPVLARADLNQNAYVISSAGSTKFDNSNLRFDPSAYCDAGGAIKTTIDTAWETSLTEIVQQFPTPSLGDVRSEIKTMEIKINLASGSHCVVPLKTADFSSTAASSDGQCLFMILRNSFSDLNDTSEPQPYLAIFSKTFADAVGFTKADMEDAAVQFQCLGL